MWFILLQSALIFLCAYLFLCVCPIPFRVRLFVLAFLACCARTAFVGLRSFSLLYCYFLVSGVLMASKKIIYTEDERNLLTQLVTK